MSLIPRHIEIDPALAASRRYEAVDIQTELIHFGICFGIFFTRRAHPFASDCICCLLLTRRVLVAMATSLLLSWYTRKVVLGPKDEAM